MAEGEGSGMDWSGSSMETPGDSVTSLGSETPDRSSSIIHKRNERRQSQYILREVWWLLHHLAPLPLLSH